jgi:hypothetical protein
MNKFLSRKFIMTIVLGILAFVTPIVFAKFAISETVILAVLGLYTGIGVTYGILNVREKKTGA